MGLLPASAVLGQLGPGVGAVAVQVQRAAREHDAPIAHAHQLLTLDVVGQRDGGLVLVGLGFGADLQLPVHHDPLGGQGQVGLVREAQLAVDRQAVQRRWTHVQHHVLATCDLHLVAGDRHLVVRPGGRIRPAHHLGRRLSCLNDSACAAKHECRNERYQKERAILVAHEPNPLLEETTTIRAAKHSAIHRRPAHATCLMEQAIPSAGDRAASPSAR